MRLLCARIMPQWGHVICHNPHIRERFGKPVLLAQAKRQFFEEYADDWLEMIFDTPAPEFPDISLDLIRRLFDKHQFTHVLAPQKLLWYSDILEKVSKERRAELTWCENFFDDRIIFDRSGLQYCRDNDIRRFEHFPPVVEPTLPKRTREFQPIGGQAANLGLDVNRTVIVFGQVPFDMALREHPGLGYSDWLRALFTQNPDVTFLFKHHPLVPTAGIDTFQNVRVIDDSLDSLFGSFLYFAAFSSTTIFEGCIRGCKFITGGYHFCSGCDTTIEAPNDLSNVIDRLRYFKPSIDKWKRRLSFVCNYYTLALDNSPLVANRLTTSSMNFFGAFRRL